jgi:hypothetical protein
MTQFDDFVTKNNGQPVEVEDPSNLDQCFDLAFAWCDFINIPRETIRHLNAYQIWTQPVDITLKYFDYIPNTPNGIPPQGAIVVFTQAVGSAGHVSIASGKGDTNSFESFDQNWSGAKYAKLVTHPYTSVYGWLRKKEASTNDPTILGQSDAFIALCTELKVTVPTKDNALAKLKAQNEQIMQLEGINQEKDRQNSALSEEIQLLKGDLQKAIEQNKALQDNLTAATKVAEADEGKLALFEEKITELEGKVTAQVMSPWQHIITGLNGLLRR